MLSAKDCLDYLNLTVDEINEIVFHEKLEMIVAIKKCSCLLDSPEGIIYLHSVFLDNFNSACNDGEFDKANKTMLTYKGFALKYPFPNYLSSR